MSKQYTSEGSPGVKRRKIEDSSVSPRKEPSQPCLEVFVYEPLDHGSDSIRLIELHPDPPDAIIRCTMRHASLSEAGYICLSYTWQPSHPKHWIEVNGRSLSIGKNLYQFLHAYRNVQAREHPHPKIWIDALCIQQSDTDEKNHQVRQMGEIYKNAAKVLIWLGVLDDALKHFLTEFYALSFDSTQDLYEDVADSSPSSEDSNVITERIRRHLSAFDSTHDLQLQDQAIALLDKEYWTRIWIAQEILLPAEHRVSVFDGTNSHEMTALGRYLDEILESTGTIGVDISDWYFTWRGHGLRETPSLPSLLHHFSNSGCQDERDRIFALLPLAQAEPSVEIDYDIDATLLLRTVLGQYMVDMHIEDLLDFGTKLIEALEVRRPISHSNDGSSSDSIPELENMIIARTPLMPIAPLVWATSNLLSMQHDPGLSYHEEPVPCVFIGVFDATNVHVLEYAVQETALGVTVRYARAHEYLHGTLQRCEDEGQGPGSENYRWLDMPTEDVYYFDGAFSTSQDRPAQPQLSTWTSPKIKIQAHTSASAPQSTRHLLKPARRFVKMVTPWLTTSNERFDPKIFSAARQRVEAVKARYRQDGKIELTPPSSRSCTVRILG
jgi:hypothetical protein